MIRLVLTIIVVLYIANMVADFLFNKIEMAMFYNAGLPFYVSQFQGTFDLLDDAIINHESADFESALAKLRTRFKTPLSLKYEHDLDLPENGWEIIGNGSVYLHDLGDSTSLHRVSVIPGRVWSLSVVPTYEEERVALLTGTLTLIKERLAVEDESRRTLAIEEIGRAYNVPLNLKSLAELDLNEEETSLLDTGQIVTKKPFESGEKFFLALDNPNAIIQFGPIDYPATFESRLWIDSIIFVAIVLTCILLWAWPLWRDLQRLRKASGDIGNGKLDSRVPSHPASLIKPIINSFNDMATRTESMVDSQRELTNAVSHELRTPLARMMFDLQMAKDANPVLRQSRHLDSLETNIGELNTLVDELLAYARQERTDSPIELETMSTDDMQCWLTDQITRAHHGHENTCQITIHFDQTNIIKKSLKFSPRLMAHALSNTLQNALRYSQKNIIVQLESHKNEWILSVEDDGVGIPHDQHERVFEPFSRLDESRQRGSGGFGMGLSIVRKVAQWHQGNALVAPSKLLGGTRIEIRWPTQVESD